MYKYLLLDGVALLQNPGHEVLWLLGLGLL